MSEVRSGLKPRARGRLAAVGTLAGLAIGASIGFQSYNKTEPLQELMRSASEPALPTVTLVAPTVGTAEFALTLPATIEARVSAKIHSRASGYVAGWSTDIGERVKKGQVLATIDAPDLDQQLAQARANLIKAQANETLAKATADRWTILAERSFVSQQAKDEKVGDAKAKAGAVASARAIVDQLAALGDFKSIVAPFDGIITSRSIDVGNLVGVTGPAGQALFIIVDISRVRVYVSVAQSLVDALKPGLKASLTLPQYPGKTFEAVLTTTSNAVSESSRSVLVQLQAENTNGDLWPGAYAELTFQFPTNPNALRVPSSALIFNQDGMQVATVKDGKVVMMAVRLGRNLGSEVEILSGLAPSQMVVAAPADGLQTGDVVQIVQVPEGSH